MCRSAKIVLYVSVEFFKGIPLGVIVIVRYKYFPAQHVYFYIACVAFCFLHTQWLVLRTILLSGNVVNTAGPETLDFCIWNLNSSTTYDFLRVSLIEAYNSVYNYDLIGIVETHLDSTVDEDRLALDGYTFIMENHPQNVKRGGVELYIEDALPSKNCPDLVTLLQCIFV